MRKTVLILLVTLSMGKINAQNSSDLFEPSHTFSLGIGAPNQFKTLVEKASISIYDIDFDKYNIEGVGPYHFKYEYRLTKIIGIGASINYTNISGSYSGTNPVNTNDTFDYNAKISSTSVLFRANIHFVPGKSIDPYVGIGAGYKGYSVNLSTTNTAIKKKELDLPLSFPLGFEMTVGTRFFFTENIGAYVEFGLAKSIIQGGISLKF